MTYTERIHKITRDVGHMFSTCSFLEPQDLGGSTTAPAIFGSTRDSSNEGSIIYREAEIIALTEVLRLYSEMIKSGEAAISSLDDGFSYYFNDHEINKTMNGAGDGLNLIKGNAFCNTIGCKYTYPNVRDLIWKHLPLYLNETNILSPVEMKIPNFINELTEIENSYDKGGLGGHIVSSNARSYDQEIEYITAQYIFWESKKPESVIIPSLSQIIRIFDTLTNCGSRFKSLTKEWLDIAMDAITTLSMAMNLTDDNTRINDDTLVNNLKNNVNNVNHYSPKVTELFRVVEPIAEAHKNDFDNEINYSSPLVDMDDNSEPFEVNLPTNENFIFDDYKDGVFNYLNVKSRSDNIYHQMESNFLIIETP